MTPEIARDRLLNLIDRIVVDAASGRASIPGGVLSARELAALRFAADALATHADPPVREPSPGVSPVPLGELAEPKAEVGQNAAPPAPPLGEERSDTQEAPAAAEQGGKPEPPVAGTHSAAILGRTRSAPDLDLSSLNSAVAEDQDVLLCLDFGTAMSKAFACVVGPDNYVSKNLLLRLGERAGEGSHRLAVSSSLWIGDDERVYAGREALRLSASATAGRARFDSLKEDLSKGEPTGSLHQQRLGPDLNPTSVPLTRDDAITTYLAYLTDLACSELQNRHGRSRYVRRRFALPSWPDDRRAWGEDILRDMLARAQIVADTLRGRWKSGIPADELKNVLDAVRRLTRRPDHLIDVGVSEPLAAGASRLRQDETSRGLVAVVDVGAGTTDFALFLVSENTERGIFRAWPLKGGSTYLPAAGNHLDDILKRAIVEKARLDIHDAAFKYVNVRLSMVVREYKEDLFRTGMCSFSLPSGDRGTIERDEFLRREDVGRFRDLLSGTFQTILGSVDRSFVERLHPAGLRVVLTGGGATLPMIQSLAEGTSSVHGLPLSRHRTELVPDMFQGDSLLRIEYPQLAVAIGGALPDLMSERDALTEMPGLAVDGWHLG